MDTSFRSNEPDTPLISLDSEAANLTYFYLIQNDYIVTNRNVANNHPFEYFYDDVPEEKYAPKNKVSIHLKEDGYSPGPPYTDHSLNLLFVPFFVVRNGNQDFIALRFRVSDGVFKESDQILILRKENFSTLLQLASDIVESGSMDAKEAANYLTSLAPSSSTHFPYLKPPTADRNFSSHTLN